MTAAFRILLVGNCIQDQVFTLPRYPQEDDEIRALDTSLVLGGNACNSAQVLRQLGHAVNLMCSLADDDTADRIRKQLAKVEIATNLCLIYPGYSTPVSSIWLNQQNASRTIVHHRDLPELTYQHLLRINPEDFHWIHFEGRNIQALIDLLPGLQQSGVPMSLEIEKQRVDIEQLVPYFNTIIISSHYLKDRNISPQQTLNDLKQLNPKCNLVCTLGDRGLLAMNSEDKIITIDAEPVQRAADTRGAGDCFIAGLISALLQQYSFEAALDLANKLAARKIQFKGLKFEERHV